MLGGLLSLSLAGCDLAKNQLKIDRSSDMEVQDYRDALAPRLPDIAEKNAPDSKIPDLKPYIATPTDRMKTMPLVSISVNQSIPLKDILYELAEQADYDIELDPRIRGSVIFSARNRPFDQVIDRLAESAGLRYKFEGDSVRVELDTPYHEIYKINYLSYVRTNTSSITNDVAVVSGEGADTGSSFKAEAKSENDFWAELDSNLQQILTVNRDAGTLRTQRDPRITNVSEAAAQVDPILMTANGEMTVAAPNAVLRVEPLSPEDDPDSQNQTGEDPFLPRFSLNKQAGMISVFASERLHKQVRDYLDMLRRSVTSQVLIEAKVLEVALNDEFAAGINWSLPGIFGSGTSFGVNSTGAGLIPRFEGPSDPGINLSAVYASGDLNAAVEAMARFGAVRALASPRLTVLNNQSAVLNVARNQVYFQLQLEREEREAPEPDRVNINSNIRNVPEGVLINVQPAINLEERVVSMAVRPTVTRIVDYVNDPGVTIVAKDMGVDVESPVPVVNVQEFDSVIQMNSGQAIVLGGLIQDRTTSVQNAVPVLGEVPLFGALFRNQGDKIEKTELVVFLKATIMEGGNNVHNTDRDLYRTFSQDRRPFDL
ncbi:MAG: type II and III secretion system family protein [Micavibrio sp.]